MVKSLSRKQLKWEKNRERWANDKEYQKRQERRKEKLVSYKPGKRSHLKAENELKVKEQNTLRKIRNKTKRTAKPIFTGRR